MLYQLSYGGNWSGAEGDRTPDLSVANAALSQLSYGPLGPLSSAVNGRVRMDCVHPSRIANGPSDPMTGTGGRARRRSFAIPTRAPNPLHGRDRIRTCDLYDVNVAL